MGMGIADGWFKKKFEKMLSGMLEKVGHSLTKKEKDKIIRVTSGIYMAVISISFAIFMIYFFSRMLHNRLGYETTMLIIMSIIMLRMRWT